MFDEKKFWIRVSVLAIVCIILLFSTAADALAGERKWYGIVGGGMSMHPMEQGDGHWIQEAYDSHYDLNSPTFTLGLGYKVKPWLSIEADYRDLGGMTGTLMFTSDDKYQGCIASGNPKACDAIRQRDGLESGYLETDVHGFGLSALARHKSGITLRAGFFVHHSDMMMLLDTRTDKKRQLDGNGPELPFDQRGLGYMFGIGYQYENVRVEYTHFPNVNSGGAPNLNINTFTVSVEF